MFSRADWPRRLCPGISAQASIHGEKLEPQRRICNLGLHRRCSCHEDQNAAQPGPGPVSEVEVRDLTRFTSAESERREIGDESKISRSPLQP